MNVVHIRVVGAALRRKWWLQTCHASASSHRSLINLLLTPTATLHIDGSLLPCPHGQFLIFIYICLYFSSLSFFLLLLVSFPFLLFSPFIYPFPCAYVHIIIEASRVYYLLRLASFSRFARCQQSLDTNLRMLQSACWHCVFAGNRMPVTHLLTHHCIIRLSQFLVHAETLAHLNLVAAQEQILITFVLAT